jgi:hypothetical protein
LKKGIRNSYRMKKNNLINIEANKRIRVLFKKWVKVQNDDTTDDNESRIIIEGEAIATAYEIKEFKLMKKIAKEWNNRDSNNFFN